MYLFLGPKAEGNIYLKKFAKARRQKKWVLRIVEVDWVLDIIGFAPYDIQALYLPVKDIVDEVRYWTCLVEAQETDIFRIS